MAAVDTYGDVQFVCSELSNNQICKSLCAYWYVHVYALDEGVHLHVSLPFLRNETTFVTTRLLSSITLF